MTAAVGGPGGDRRAARAALVLLLAGAGCLRPPTTPGAQRVPPRGEPPAAHAGHAAAAWEVPFTVRGRLDDPSRLRWRVVRGAGPVDDATLEAALRTAGAAWSRVDGLGFAPADENESPDVVVSWQAAADDPCGVFGRGEGVAHTGPMGGGTFVHLDASLDWCLDDRPGGERLDVALAHELGHVLGLDHSPDPGALMHPDTHLDAPAAADLAGVHALYGGGADAPGDVVIETVDGEARPAPPLRGVAPPERTAVALFDTDGDGGEELLIWRTDREGIGALTVHHFRPGGDGPGAGPRLVRTLGPMLDVVPALAVTSLRADTDGRRWIVSREGADLRVHGFDAEGWLRAPDVAERLTLDVEALLAAPGPPVLAGPATGPHRTDGAPASVLVGDLDGDGRVERVRRLEGGP